MKIGDIIERRNLLGFKGILIKKMYDLSEANNIVGQLSLYPQEECIYWKILWFKHPFETVPLIDGAMENDIVKMRRKKNEV